MWKYFEHLCAQNVRYLVQKHTIWDTFFFSNRSHLVSTLLGHCMCMSKERNLTFQFKKTPKTLFRLTQVWLSRECATLHWIMKSWRQTIHCPNINDFLEHGYWLICADYVRGSRDGSTSSAFFLSMHVTCERGDSEIHHFITGNIEV